MIRALLVLLAVSGCQPVDNYAPPYDPQEYTPADGRWGDDDSAEDW